VRGLRGHVAPAVYGQILATSLVATLSEDHEISAAQLLFWVGVTMLVFWAAHVYAAGVERRLGSDRDLGMRDIRELLVDELPELWAALPVMAALLLGTVGILSREAAIAGAIGAGVVMLAAWGLVIARRAGMSTRATIGSVAVNGAIGLAIVGLKIWIH
jgi:hypothetical protein